jgi:hypothetical protein
MITRCANVDQTSDAGDMLFVRFERNVKVDRPSVVNDVSYGVYDLRILPVLSSSNYSTANKRTSVYSASSRPKFGFVTSPTSERSCGLLSNSSGRLRLENAERKRSVAPFDLENRFKA